MPLLTSNSRVEKSPDREFHDRNMITVFLSGEGQFGCLHCQNPVERRWLIMYGNMLIQVSINPDYYIFDNIPCGDGQFGHLGLIITDKIVSLVYGRKIQK